jgi:hypothetical protein
LPSFACNQKGIAMRKTALRCLRVAALLLLPPGGAGAACCYFSAQNADILQPAQKVFLTWDPAEILPTSPP